MNKYALRQTPLAAAIACVIASGSSQAATITVNSLNDTVVAEECSLRAAIESANTATAVGGCDSGSAGADEIVFDQSLADSTISIESLLTIENSLTISGPGSDLLAISSEYNYGYEGIFEVDFSSNPYQELIIRGLTLADGYADYAGGGAIRMQTPDTGYSAALTIEDSVLASNFSTYSGGAIAFGTHDCGGLTVRNSMFSDNYSERRGGAIHFEADADCLLSIENSLLTHNESDEVGGAVYAESYYLNMSITDNSMLAFNRTRYAGGGLGASAKSGGEISIHDSYVFGNDVRLYYGGGMAIWAPNVYAGPGFHLEVGNSQIRGNRAGPDSDGSGGGMAVMVDNENGTNEAAVTITDSVISGNISGNIGTKYGPSGGGGANLNLIAADLTISGSYFQHNAASGGGGLLAVVSYGGMVTISDSRFHGNTAAVLGGLGLIGGSQTLIERTVVHDNLASVLGGAALQSEEMVVRDSEFSANTSMKYADTALSGQYSLLVENTTISGNTTQTGVAGTVLAGNNVSARFLTVTDNTLITEGDQKYVTDAAVLAVYAYDCAIDSSLIALNSSPSSVPELLAPVCEVSWSLIGDSANTEYIDAGSNLVDIDPVIGPLANNGGPTRSHALDVTSPAVNRGNPSFVPPPEFDQRGPGFPRVFGGQADIGAYELQELLAEPEDEIFSDRFEEEP